MWTTFNPSFFHSFHLTAHLTRQLDLHAHVQQDHHLYEKWRVYLVKRRAKNGTDSFSLQKKCFCSSLDWFQQECDIPIK